MLMIGENLKKLRHREAITQEQLAEVLGVTPQAVSRWENCTSLPDITLIPMLANYFGVSADELLGIDIERRQQQIDEALEYNNKLNREGRIDESIAYMREKVRLFPNSVELLYQLIVVLYKGTCKPQSRSDKQLEEVISLCERTMRLDGGRTWVTECCKQWLCFSNNRLGNSEKAVEIAQGMATAWISKEILLPKVLDTDGERVQRQQNLLTFMDILVINLHHLSRMRNDPLERIELLQKAVSLIHLIAGEDAKFYNERLYKCHLWIAFNYCRLGDLEKTATSLNASLECAVSYESRPERSVYEAYWLSDVEDSREKVWKDHRFSLYEHLLDEVRYSQDFAPFRETTDYVELCSRIEQYIG